MENKRRSGPTFATSPDIELLCERFDFLEENRERILADPLLAGCHPRGISVGFSIAGAIPISLGLLLDEYSQGHLIRPCDCGGNVYLLRGGAGVGGHSVLTGWCPRCRQKRRIELTGTGVGFREFIDGILAGRSRRPLGGALSLGQVCDHLEGKPVETWGRKPSGQPVLRFEPRTGDLFDVIRFERVGTCLLSVDELAGLSREADSCEPPYGGSGGRLHVLWERDWTDTPIPGIPKGEWILRTRNHPNAAERVLLGLGSGVLSARERGAVLKLDGRIPLRLLGLWAWKQGMLAM